MSFDFRFDPTDNLDDLGTTQVRYQRNLDALRLTNSLLLEGRDPHISEQYALAHYVGWGDSNVLKLAFPPVSYRAAAVELQKLLTSGELSDLKGSTLNAYYTALPIVRAIWRGLVHLGAAKLRAPRLLDSSAGIGHFFSAMPREVFENSSRVEVELDTVTARILKRLHPNSKVFAERFETVPLPKSFFDIAVTNVPFGEYQVADATIKQQFLKRSIHDYFIVKMLESVRPGGVVAVITSRFTLDKAGKEVREYIAERADLLAAVRLPNDTFRKNAGTDVVTDVLFLRRRETRATAEELSKMDWIDVTPQDISISNHSGGVIAIDHNEIYRKHHDWMLGKPMVARNQYGTFSFDLNPDGRDVPQALGDLLCSILPADILVPLKDEPIEAETTEPPPLFCISPKMPIAEQNKVFGMKLIYEAAKEMLALEIDGADQAQIDIARRKLNFNYDDFIKRNGPLNRLSNWWLIRGQAALPFLKALEVVDGLTNRTRKADLFDHSTVRPRHVVTSTNDPKEALLLCLDRFGEPRFDFICQITGQSREYIENALKGLIYVLPGGRAKTAESYLSGDIRKKLDEAKAAALADSRFEENKQALELVMPAPLKAGEIVARLGAGWIPVNVVKDFVAFTTSGLNCRLTYLARLGEWVGEPAKDRWAMESFDATQRYGTKRTNSWELIMDALNMKIPVVYDTLGYGKNAVRVLNQQETVASQARLAELKALFEEWVWQDRFRSIELTTIYNERFNSIRQAAYDGNHLSLPGLSTAFSPYDHQKSAVWRILQNKTALIGHEVGLGKTLVGVIAAMELKRMKLAHKFMVVVPNHLTEQWQKDAIKAYPNASILCAGKDDFTPANRGKFLSTIATNDWDIVIVPHSSFKLLPISNDTLQGFVKNEIATMEAYLLEISEDQQHGKPIKEIEKAIKRLRARLETLSEMKKDPSETITFEEMGIDALFVDEAHCLPYDAAIETNLGTLPIGEIVTRKLNVRVKSVDTLTGEVKWMPVTDWTDDPQSEPLVRIVHEKGELVCTADHEIWTEEDGYVEAKDLTVAHHFKTLPDLREGCEEDGGGPYGHPGHGPYGHPGQVELSGMIRVEVFESAGENGSSLGAQSSPRVYCLEVAGTHNFFADGVLVANCFKNLYFATKMSRIAGIPTSNSERAFDMYIKTQWTLQHGGRVIFATGTPVSNTLAEVYTMMRYLQADMLEEQGLGHFDAWSQCYADAVPSLEMTPDGSGFRMNTRFARFTNLPELTLSWRQVLDVRTAAQSNIVRPDLFGDKPITIRLPSTPQLKDFVKGLAERVERIKKGGVPPWRDNMLKITSEGRKAALDIRLVMPNAPTNPYDKITAMTETVYAIYEASSSRKAVQLIFCDLGTPKGAKDSNKDTDPLNSPVQDDAKSVVKEEVSMARGIYHEIKRKLVASGIPSAEVAFIHDCKTPADRTAMFEAVNAGRIRVLIGSTEKMGTGMNAQKRILGLHHLDAPWRPSDIEQREGRMLRQGNGYAKVFVFQYVTEGSFDGYVWQTLESKARFITKVMAGEITARSAEDVGELVLTMAEVKALASGNPKVMRKVVMENELTKLGHLLGSWRNSRQQLQMDIAGLPARIKTKTQELAMHMQCQKARTILDPRVFSLRLVTAPGAQETYVEFTDREKAGAYLRKLAEEAWEKERHDGATTFSSAIVHLGLYRGFVIDLKVYANPGIQPDVHTHLAGDFPVYASSISDSNTGTIQRIDNQLEGINDAVEEAQNGVDKLTLKKTEVEAEIDRPWEHTDRYTLLKRDLALLNYELTKTGDNPGAASTADDLTAEEMRGAGQNVTRSEHVTSTQSLNDVLAAIAEMHPVEETDDEEYIALLAAEIGTEQEVDDEDRLPDEALLVLEGSEQNDFGWL